MWAYAGYDWGVIIIKVIYAVSPDYLEALYSEAKKYNFCLQGYGNLEDAIKGLKKTNISEILGFIFVGRELYYSKEGLSELLNTCNRLCRYSPKKFIFALQNSKGLADALEISSFENLKVSYLPDFEILTDTVINKQLFGSILLDSYEPYLLHEQSEKNVVSQSATLKYEPLFSDYVLKCLDPVDKLNTYEMTTLNDKIYQEYLSDGSDLAIIRECFIKKVFNISYDKKAVREILKYREEAQQYCVYRALISII